MARSHAPWLLLGAVTCAAAAGCGPSLRMVHQSEAYFERCHAADYDPSMDVEQRRECWAAWIEHYREGQRPDRVGYANRRLTALEAGTAATPLPGLEAQSVRYTASFLGTTQEQAPAGEADPAVAVPTQQSIEIVQGQPPVHEDAHGVRSDRDDREPTLMRGPCAQVCGPRWDTCSAACEGRERPCERACETEHRVCMRGCF